MRTKAWQVVTVLVVAALLLTACGTPTPEVVEKEPTQAPTKKAEEVATTAPASPDEPVYGGSLISVLGTSDTQGFKTWGDTTSTEMTLWTQVYDTFVRYDDEYNIAGSLFESWESDDAQTWTFKVRQGVKWHDGVDLVAQHFVDYIDTVLDPEAGASSETIDLFKDATYEAVDDYTFKLGLPRPDAALLDGFAAQWLSRPDDFDPEHPLGTGPFKFIEWKRNQHVKFEKNPDYWQEGLPYVDELTIMFVPDGSTRKAMLLSGEAHILQAVPLPEVEMLEKEENIQLIKTPDQYMVSEYFFLMNCSQPPFDDARVRRAINYALDREAMLQTTFGYGWLKANPVAEGSWAYNPNAEYPKKQDMEKAKELMKEAGYEPGKPAFTVTLKYWKERPENLQICQIAQANLAELGITVELELLEIMQWVQKVLWDYEYEAALTSLVPRWDPNDQLGNCYTTDDGAALQWENEEFLKYWQAGRATSDLEERKEAYWKAQEIAAQEAPCAILNGSPAFAAATSNVRGVVRYNRGKLWYERVWLVP